VSGLVECRVWARVDAREGDARTAQLAASRNSRSRRRTPLVPRQGLAMDGAIQLESTRERNPALKRYSDHPPAAPVTALPGARLPPTAAESAALSGPLDVPAPHPPPTAAAAPPPPPPARVVHVRQRRPLGLGCLDAVVVGTPRRVNDASAMLRARSDAIASSRVWTRAD